MPTRDEKPVLNTEEQKFIDVVTTHYTPPPLTATQSAAFARALEERLNRPSPFFRVRFAPLVATACAGLLLWFGFHHYGLYSDDHAQQISTGVQEEPAPKDKNATLLTYAYYGDELYGEDTNERPEDVLPDDYEALAAVFVPTEG